MKRDVPAHGQIEFEDVGQGRAVVLLHAFPLSHTMWRRQIEALASEYRVIAPSMRGFNSSAPWTTTPSIGRMADDVRALLDELHILEPVTLCGLSMGGYIALALTRMFPRRVGALVLADTRAEADDEAAKAKRNANIEFAQNHSAHEFIDRLLPNMVSEKTRAAQPETIRQIIDIASGQSREGIIGALHALRDRPDSSAGLQNIGVPTLVVVGSDDAITPPSVAQTLATNIPQAQLQTIEGAGHLSSMEQPEQFNQALLSFLGRLQ
ncbi:MAG TPA: alpha/beta fold hydrolase [Abditibacteriaceae bacterium]|jgi:pimeloyl-ACP methyl ester carboxylesterase